MLVLGAFADVFLEEGLAPVFDSVDGYTINSDVPEAGALGSAIGDVAYEILEGAVGGKVAGKAGRLVKSCDPPNSVPARTALVERRKGRRKSRAAGQELRSAELSSARERPWKAESEAKRRPRWEEPPGHRHTV
ncbi:hypothetical protein YTPLAS18_40660 [Nitrospira sp.]|nr:hypothetical protein YTPLAS18_40660 [Nitrospira sp.]